MSQETPELFTGKQGGRAESNSVIFVCMMVLWGVSDTNHPSAVLLCCCFVYLFFLGDDLTPLKFCNFGCYYL